MKEWDSFDKITNAKGVWLIDSKGNKMIDGVASMWCNVWGHSNPQLVKAITIQSKKLQHSSMFNLTNEPAEQLAKKLTKISPGMYKVFYSDNGSSAMEIAIKIALQYWKNIGEKKKTEIATLKNGYHGDKHLRNQYYFETYFSFSMSDDKLTHKEFKEIEQYFLDSNFNTFKEKMLELDKKSSFFLEMFSINSLDNLNEQKKLSNGFYNAIKISYPLEEDKHDKLYPVPYSKFISLSYDILIKIENIDHFLVNFFTTINSVLLIVKIEIYERIAEQLNNKLTIEDNTKEEIFKYLKDRLEKLTLAEFLNDEKITIYILPKYNIFDLTLDKIKEELNNFIFKEKDNFFKVIDKFKYLQYSSDGSEWLIQKSFLENLIDLEKIEEYINKLKVTDLDDTEQELLKIWNKKFRW
jgi:hypothetical protein